MKVLSRVAVCACLLSSCTAPVWAQLASRPADDWVKVLESPERIKDLKIDQVVAALNLKAGDVVADLGAGAGPFVPAFAKAVTAKGVYAVEIDKSFFPHIEVHLAPEKWFVIYGRQATQGAGPEEAAILSVVDRFMDGITNSDAALLAELHVEGSFTVVSRPNAAGGDPQVVRRAFTPPRAGGRAFRERYWDPVVHVRGGIAVVWTPYEFWIDGKTSHCGIDVFDLMKDKGVWKIANAMWTVEPDACPALRPSDPSRIRPSR